ncbi:MAG: dienelactone hydrolase family protein [Myxococcales bacterium]
MKIVTWLSISWLLVGLTACAHKRAPTVVAPTGELPAQTAAKAQTQVQTEEVTYTSGSTALKGFIAYPSNLPGKRPGVLVVHEWWGLNDYVRSRVRQLAELGYVALAVDMFGEGKTAEHPTDANKFMMEVMSNQAEAKQRFDAGLAMLKANAHTNPEEIAVIGYCMGGAVALNMLRAGENLPLVATFHGNLATQAPLQPGTFSGKLMVFTGGSDPFVPAEQLANFRKEMDAAGANYEVVEYPEAKHGFTNPDATAAGSKFSLPLAYDAAADSDSWSRFTNALATLWPSGTAH